MTALVGDPDLVLDGAAEVAFDARATKPVTVDVGEDGLEPSSARCRTAVDGFTGSIFGLPWIDGFYAQPMEAPNAEDFAFTTPLAPAAAHARADRGQGAARPHHAGRFDLPRRRRSRPRPSTPAPAAPRSSPRSVGGRRQGRGRHPLERGLAERSAPSNALAAGATLLIVVNDADGELSEWVGSRRLHDAGRHPGRRGQRRAGPPAPRGDRRRRRSRSRASASRHADGDLRHRARYSDGSIPDGARLPADGPRAHRHDVPRQRGRARRRVPLRLRARRRLRRGLHAAHRARHRAHRVGEHRRGRVVPGRAGHRRPAGRSATCGGRTSPTRSRRQSCFGPIVRPYVGPGYWAPNRTGGYAQVNVPSWADGGSAQHTGAFDIFCRAHRPLAAHRGVDRRRAVGVVAVAGGNRVRPPRRRDRVARAATPRRTTAATSRRRPKTVTEWTFRSTGHGRGLHRAAAADDAGVLRRRRSTPRARSAPAARRARRSSSGSSWATSRAPIGSAELTGATLEVRVAGGDWKPVDARGRRDGRAVGPGRARATTTSSRRGRSSTAYTATIAGARLGRVDRPAGDGDGCRGQHVLAGDRARVRGGPVEAGRAARRARRPPLTDGRG